MKPIVCFKTIPDYARLSETDWAWDDHGRIDTGFVRRIFNCFDESSLEMALNLAALYQNPVESPGLTALTVDGPQSDLFLRHLLAVGYESAVRIAPPPDLDLRFNPSAVSLLISEFIRQKGHDLVFTGIQGGDGDNWQTGLLIAERLGWPCIRDVNQVEKTEEPGWLKVTSRVDGGGLVQTVRLPLVLTVGQCLDSPCLRFPTLRQKLDAKKKAITVVSNLDLEIDNDILEKSSATLIGLARPGTQQTCVFLDGRDIRQQARSLYERYLKDRMPL